MKEANRIKNIKEYYFSNKMREIRSLIADGKAIINLGIGNPDLPPPPQVIKALKSAASQLDKHGYQAYKGLAELREAISIFYQKHYQVKLQAEDEILPLTGAKEGVMHISMAFLNKGDAVLIPNPGYMTYSSITNLLGATAISYLLKEENNWYPDFKEIEKNDLTKVKIMWVNYPHMPTGAKASIKLFEDIINFAKKHQILVINDNPYSFILNEKPLSILAVSNAKEHALELNSLSKTFNMAGWRVGMLLGSKRHINSVLKVKSNMDSGMYYGLQKGAIKALLIEKSWYEAINKIYKKRRKIVWKIAQKLDCTFQKETHGLFVWAKLPSGKKSEETTNSILNQKQVFITPGSLFGSLGEGYLRFSLCVDEKNLLDVLNRIDT